MKVSFTKHFPVKRFSVILRKARRTVTFVNNYNQGQKWWHISAKQKNFYLCRSVNSKNMFFVAGLTLSPRASSMLKYASLTLSRGYNIEKGRGGRNVKTGDWKTHAFNETGLFQGVSQLLLSMIEASFSVLENKQVQWYPLLTKLVCSRWLDIGLVLFLRLRLGP